MRETTFIKEVAQRLGSDERRAEAVTFAVFQELRDRLPPKEAADVSAQLPTGLRPLLEDYDRPGRGVERTHRAEFIGRVRRWAGLSEREAERAVTAVFAELQKLLGSSTGLEGEAWDVFSVLPKDLKKVWLAARDAA